MCECEHVRVSMTGERQQASSEHPKPRCEVIRDSCELGKLHRRLPWGLGRSSAEAPGALDLGCRHR